MKGRRCGWVIQALITGADEPGSTLFVCGMFTKQVKGIQLSLELRKSKAVRKRSGTPPQLYCTQY